MIIDNHKLLIIDNYYVGKVATLRCLNYKMSMLKVVSETKNNY